MNENLKKLVKARMGDALLSALLVLLVVGPAIMWALVISFQAPDDLLTTVAQLLIIGILIACYSSLKSNVRKEKNNNGK